VQTASVQVIAVVQLKVVVLHAANLVAVKLKNNNRVAHAVEVMSIKIRLILMANLVLEAKLVQVLTQLTFREAVTLMVPIAIL